MIDEVDGKRPVIAADAFVAPSATVIGEVELAEGASVWYGCVLRGDAGRIRIGARTNVQDLTTIHERTTLGAGVTIGHRVVLHHCTVEDDAMVGIGAVVLDGAVIEKGAVVAAGAMVPPGKRVKAGEMWAGVPARMVRPVKPEETEFIRINAGLYCELAAKHRS
jgi:gamma-carbonic anhydrase